MKRIILKYGFELELKIPLVKWHSFMDQVQLFGDLANDSSIDHTSLQNSVEIRSRVGTRNTIFFLTDSICTILADSRASVNQSCGFHLHVSNKSFFVRRNINRIVFLWCAIEDVLISTQPTSRYNNGYCRRRLKGLLDEDPARTLPIAKGDLVHMLGTEDRYYALNLQALKRHGTIEIRLHAGTTNPEKIKMWIELMTALFNYAVLKYNHKDVLKLFNTKISDEKIEQVFNLLELTPAVKKHFLARIDKFGFTKMAEEQEVAIKYMKALPSFKRQRNLMKKLQRKVEQENNKLREIRNMFSPQRPETSMNERMVYPSDYQLASLETSNIPY